jgi:hypothetical protein
VHTFLHTRHPARPENAAGPYNCSHVFAKKNGKGATDKAVRLGDDIATYGTPTKRTLCEKTHQELCPVAGKSRCHGHVLETLRKKMFSPRLLAINQQHSNFTEQHYS